MVYSMLIAFLVSYLLGNLNGAVCMSAIVAGDDVRSHGSGNAGLTNFFRTYGGIVTLLVIGIDVAKCVIACLIALWLLPAYGIQAVMAAGVAVIFGHSYPVFAGFRGGKGVASSFAIAWVTFPLGAAITTAAAAIVLAATKKVSLVSLSGMLVFLITTLIFRITDIALVALSVILTAIVYLRHTDNIRRLLHYEEKQIVN